MAEAAPLVAVLAAGLGRRFGGGKLDADCAGKPLGQWALDAVAAAGLAPGVIVTGPVAPGFAAAARGWTVLTNPAPDAGQGGSLAMAAQAALGTGRDLLVVLADMPLVSPDHLWGLAATSETTATRWPGDRAGVPALLTGDILRAAASLSGERGAALLLAGSSLLDAPPGTLADADTPADLARIIAVIAA